MSVVDVEAGEVVAELTAEEAAELTRDIAGELEFAWELISRAYRGRAWAALGYLSWDEYCTNEFGASRLALPREERAEVVQSLRSQGLSLRAIAAATGAGLGTVKRDVDAGVPNGTPDEGASNDAPANEATVTGIDGKSYQPTKTTTRESKSTTVEYADDRTDDEADKEPAPPSPIPGENDPDVDGLADRILPDEVNYRPVLSSVIERAGSALRNLDVERAANAIRTADDAEGYRRSLRDMRDRLDQVLKATQPDHLRSVK